MKGFIDGPPTKPGEYRIVTNSGRKYWGECGDDGVFLVGRLFILPGEIAMHAPIELGCETVPRMTYRQWLIGMALQGVLASRAHIASETTGGFGTTHQRSLADYKLAADHAVEAADAVIAQLESEKP